MKRTSKRAPGRSRGGYRLADDSGSLGTSVPSLAAARGRADSPPLARAKSQWLVGDWNALCELDADTVARHPERDKLALLVACAHQQRADHELAREYTRRAIEWGCDPKLVARLLISGVHNTLGRIAALKADDSSLHSHFTQALAVTGDSEGGLATSTRALRELADLGLLPQAAQLLLRSTADSGRQTQRPVDMSTQIQVLSDELARLQRCVSHGAHIGLPTGLCSGAQSTDQYGTTNDTALLASVRAQWENADWYALVNLREDEITQRPERAHLAIYAAAGKYQVGDYAHAKILTNLALEWGCSPQMAEKILLTGAHNSLTKAMELLAKQAPENH